MEDWESVLEQTGEDGHLTEKQKRIVQAAIESFAEKGFSATSTNEIAQKAGVAEGTIFRHYKTKKRSFDRHCRPSHEPAYRPFCN